MSEGPAFNCSRCASETPDGLDRETLAEIEQLTAYEQ
jgi:hypothetical protein